ncbi:hypothetical protein Mapa_000368 [Marchantia paleacea]|nr:hypothetical protein Mapa_000368 [Marchantia paleacea]
MAGGWLASHLPCRGIATVLAPAPPPEAQHRENQQEGRGGEMTSIPSHLRTRTYFSLYIV